MAKLPKPAAMPSEDDFRAKDDARTLMGAEEIRGDASRHKKAKVHVRKTMRSAARALGKPKHRYDRAAVVQREDMR